MTFISDHADSGYIEPVGIDDRIWHLMQETKGDEEFAGAFAEDIEELAELRRFRDQVSAKVNNWSNATIVEADAFIAHVRDEAEDIYGAAAIELGPYMEWDRYADSRKMDYGAVVVDDETYYVR